MKAKCRRATEPMTPSASSSRSRSMGKRHVEVAIETRAVEIGRDVAHHQIVHVGVAGNDPVVTRA